MENKELARIASQVRRDIVRMVSAVSSGHPGGSLGCADFLTMLYFDQMNHDASAFNMDGNGEDLFFLSNGHISPVWYSVLARAGYFPTEELATFRKISSRLQLPLFVACTRENDRFFTFSLFYKQNALMYHIKFFNASKMYTYKSRKISLASVNFGLRPGLECPYVHKEVHNNFSCSLPI